MNLSELVEDKISNIDSIYAAQQEKAELRTYNGENDRNTKSFQKRLRTLWKLRVFEELLLTSSFIVFNYMVYKSKLPRKTIIALYLSLIHI